MQVAKHAQPALLYLVPGVTISLWGTALVKGDLKALWNYSEEPEAEKSKGKPKEKNETEDAKTLTWYQKLWKTVDGGKAEGDKKGDTTGTEKSSDSESATDDEKDGETGKADDKHAGKLVYFAITLPTDDGPGGGQKLVEAANAESTGNAIESAPMKQDGGTTGSMTRSKGPTVDGEPPGKRARKA
jgi:minor histocompatibility antigen H13